MEKELTYVSEEELAAADKNVIESYLYTLEGIEAGLDEYIEEKQKESKNDNNEK